MDKPINATEHTLQEQKHVCVVSWVLTRSKGYAMKKGGGDNHVPIGKKNQIKSNQTAYINTSHFICKKKKSSPRILGLHIKMIS